MSEIQSISSLETQQFLQEKYGSGIVDVKQVGEGGWSLAFAFVHEGVRNVIRWSDIADNFERDAVAARFTSDGLPVPPITGIGRGLNKFFAISPFVGGTYLETLSSSELENTLPSLLKMLRALRAINLSGTTGFGFWNKDGKGSHGSWKEFLQKRLEECTRSSELHFEVVRLNLLFAERKYEPMSNSPIPIKEFRLDLSELTYTGHDLVRPESILAKPNGTLWVSDGRGGVTRIDPDGQQTFLGGLGGEPNGLAMADDGSIFVANIGTGTIQKLHPAGHSEEFLTEVDGVKLTSANYIFLDSQSRLWMAFSTRESHWWPAAANPRPDGYIVLLDEKGPRIIRDDIFFTNEIRLDATEEYLYVAETMKSRIIRFRVQPDGSLTEKEVVGPDGLGVGAEVDGFAFDAEGNIWVTTVLRNGVGIITTDGDYHVVFEEANEPLLATFDEKIAAGTGQPADMMATAGKTLQFVTSMTFAGPDLRTVYVGSLGMNRLPTFRSPVPGLPMRHWKK